MAVAQRLISNMMRHCVGAWGEGGGWLTEVIPDIE